MRNESITNKGVTREESITERFLDSPGEETFTDLFKVLTPHLVAFFRARRCDLMAEDLAQEVMLTVYRFAAQLRERALFRAWVFRIARNTLSRHYTNQSREVETVDMANLPDRLVADTLKPGGTPAFEFFHWMAFLNTHEREALTLRFIEDWEYHEIAAARAIPIGTVQWRVFSAKKKLAPILKRTEASLARKAA
jgi:RNA polymerase sigma-70 factor (ECF subfamily)